MAEELAEPVRQSYLMWFLSALGWRYAWLLPLVGSVAFVLTLILVLRGKGPLLVGALLFIVPLPIFVGIAGVVDGMLASFQVIMASQTSPAGVQWARGFSMSLVTGWVGMLLAVPSYLLASARLVVRSLNDGAPNAKSPP